jgi:hypothetical protein
MRITIDSLKPDACMGVSVDGKWVKWITLG